MCGGPAAHSSTIKKEKKFPLHIRDLGMTSKNRQVVANVPVEFEKNPVGV